MKAVSQWVGRYMAVIVLVVALLALFVPATCLWVQTSWINFLLMMVMFGMGLTLKSEDFVLVFRRPGDILAGCVAQYTLMPLLAFVIGRLFGMEEGLMAGMILVGCCPGGTSSNVVTYLSGGDVALSVSMTSVNTLLAPVLTPAITYLLLHATVSVDITAMFLSIVQVVILPIVLGVAFNRFAGEAAHKVAQGLPLVSVTAITLIVASVVSHNAQRILSTGPVIFAAVILHNLLGYGGGYLVARILRMTPAKTKAMAIEVGMQNSGLATSLAGNVFSALPMATVPGAIFSIWHNISGAMLAGILRRKSSNIED